MVDTLVAPVILGVDFLQNNALVLDFTSTPVTVCSGKQSPAYVASTPRPLSQQTKNDETAIAAIADQNDLSGDALEECAVPQFNTNQIELPECTGECRSVSNLSWLYHSSIPYIKLIFVENHCYVQVSERSSNEWYLKVITVFLLSILHPQQWFREEWSIHLPVLPVGEAED